MKLHMGYPWGYVDVPEGWRVAEVPASCDAECHCGHPFCWPGWKEILPPGATILSGPVLVDSGWIALVSIPPETGGQERGGVPPRAAGEG